MIDPKDIFNAHRVVANPNSYRPAAITRPMILPKPVSLRTLRHAERRRVVVVSLRNLVHDKRVRAHYHLVRNVLPRIRKR